MFGFIRSSNLEPPNTLQHNKWFKDLVTLKDEFRPIWLPRKANRIPIYSSKRQNKNANENNHFKDTVRVLKF